MLVFEALKKTAEERIRGVFTKYTFPPIEVIIPILEKAGRGEQELSDQLYASTSSLIKGIREILGLKKNDFNTLAKVFTILMTHEGQRFEPIELTESKFSLGISDCPMLHVGKNVSLNVKSKFCDLICSTGLKALKDNVLVPDSCTCTWDKALIKGAGKCKVIFELVKTK